MVAILVFAGLSPWLLGRYVRVRGELARTGWRRAEEMESRQRLVADQARLRERARIASDMHDSLGHELSLIAVRAAALEVAGGLDDAQRDAAAQLRTSAAAATERLREIIGVLREDAAPVEPVQGDLGELISRARASGLLIESDSGRASGAADGRPRRLPRGAGSADERGEARAGRRGDGPGDQHRRADRRQRGQRAAARRAAARGRVRAPSG